MAAAVVAVEGVALQHSMGSLLVLGTGGGHGELCKESNADCCNRGGCVCNLVLMTSNGVTVGKGESAHFLSRSRAEPSYALVREVRTAPMQAASILSDSVAAAVTMGGSGIGSSSLMAFSNSIAGPALRCGASRRVSCEWRRQLEFGNRSSRLIHLQIVHYAVVINWPGFKLHRLQSTSSVSIRDRGQPEHLLETVYARHALPAPILDSRNSKHAPLSLPWSHQKSHVDRHCAASRCA